MIRMSRLKVVSLFVLCVACLTASGSPAHSVQRRAAANKITARAKGRRFVVISERGVAHTLNLSNYIEAVRIEDPTVYFLTHEGEFTYLVLGLCGPSKLPPDDHECGAGVECNLIWLKLDRRWKVSDANSLLYDSCWQPIISDGGVQVEGRRLKLVYDNVRLGQETRYEVSYDADHAEKGFNVEKKPVPKDGN
jgi:hypothetical protein